MNDADLVATLNRARHKLEFAELHTRRLRDLLETGASNQDDYDAAVNELAIQKSEIEVTQAQIGKTEIRAPFDGVVGLRFVSEGAFVSSTARIATLQRLDPVKVDFPVPERYAGRIGPGRQITYTVAGSATLYKGEVLAIDPKIDPSTRTLLVRALCEKPGKDVLPGAFAKVVLELDEIPNSLFIPSVAIIPGLSENTVFVFEGGQAMRRSVQTGQRTADAVQILGGLKPGEIVITSGTQSLRSGQPVTLMNETEPKTAPPAKVASAEASGISTK